MSGSRVINHAMHRLLPVLFLVSGASALIYQLVWMRQLTLLFGTTVYAVSIVLAAFMTGLAAGSFVLGRIADRQQQPVRLYAVLEVLIGCYGLLTPWLFARLDAVYSLLFADTVSQLSMNIGRFSLAFGVVVIGAALMGGTLPVMARAAIRYAAQAGQGVGLLYGLNTLGAVFGVALSGFWLMPEYGVQQTLTVAVALNLLIAVVLLPWIWRRQGEVGQVSPAGLSASNAAAASPSWVLLVIAISGFIALAYEVIWTRVLTWIMGSSVYAFSILLMTFLLGLALGSLAGRQLLKYWADQARLMFALCQLAIALTALLVIPLLGQLPEWFLSLAEAAAPDFNRLLLTQMLLAMLIMLPGCLFLGAVFPLACHLYGGQFDQLGRQVGLVYAANTVGAIAGSIIAGFMLVPLLGSANALTVLVLGNVLLGGILLWTAQPGVIRARLAAVSAVLSVVVLSLVLPTWDPLWMNNNFINQLQSVMQQRDKILENYLTSKIVYQDEDASGHVLVYRDTDQRLNLHVNGRAEGGTSGWDMQVQVSLAAIPGLMHIQPGKVLLVGLGPGITLGTLTQLPGIEQIDVVELSSAVVKANQHFAADNHQALADARVNLIIDDARHYLGHTRKKYDLIIVGPSYTWVSGAANLFTQEFLQATQAHLNNDGLMSIWFPVYAMTPELIQVFMQTLLTVYPTNTGWLSGTFGELILIGSPASQQVDDLRLRQRLAQPAVARELARGGIHSVKDLLGQYLMGQQDIKDYAADAAVNSDNQPLLEFAVPQQVYAWDFNTNLASLFAPEREISPPVHNFAMTVDGARDYPFIGLRINLPGWQAQAEYVTHYNFVATDQRTPVVTKARPHRNTVPLLRLSRGNEQLEIRAASYANREQPPDDMEFRHIMATITGVPLAKINLSLMHERHFYWVSEHQLGQSKYVLSWFCADNARHYLAHYSHQTQSRVTFNEVYNLLANQLRCIAPD